MQSPGGSAARDKPSAPPPNESRQHAPDPDLTHTNPYRVRPPSRTLAPRRSTVILCAPKGSPGLWEKKTRQPPALLAGSDGLLTPLSDALGKGGVCASVTDRGVMLDFRTFGLLAEAATPDSPRGVSWHVVTSLFGIYW